MATLDISVIMFALIVILILDILAIGLHTIWFAFMAMIFGVFSLGYFIQNYTGVSIGTGVVFIPFDIFIVSWVVLAILGSLVVGFKSR